MNPHKMFLEKQRDRWVATCFVCTVKHTAATWDWAIRCVIAHQNLRGAYQVHDTSTKGER